MIDRAGDLEQRVVFGDLGRSAETGSQKLVCVSDEAGEIGWLQAANVRVVSIDGRPPADHLS